MTKAAGYFRVSTDRQADLGASLPTQVAEFSTYCHEQGYDPAGQYVDVMSGTRSDRPEYQRMLADAACGQFDVVVCLDDDRFGRDPEEAMYQSLRLKMEHGVRVEFIRGGAGASLSERARGYERAGEERERLSQRVKGVMLYKAQQGTLMSRAAYGYRREGNELVVREDEMAWVRKMFEWYVTENLGQPSIAARLNAAGVRTRRGATWAPPQVSKILQNPLYKGLFVWTGTDRRGQRVAVEQPVPAGISASLWQEAQERRQVKNDLAAPRAQSYDFLLSGLLRCGLCRGPMNGVTSKKGRNRYYICRRAKQSNKTECEGMMLRAEEVEDEVVDDLSSRWRSVHVIAGSREGEVAGLERALSDLEEERDRIARRMQGNNDRLDDGHTTRELWEAENTRHLAAIQSADAKRDALLEDIARIREQVAHAADTADRIASLKEIVATKPRTESKALLQAIIRRAVLDTDGKGVEIELR